MVDLLLGAPIATQALAAILLLAALVSGLLAIGMLLALRRLAALADAFEAEFWSGIDLNDLFTRIGAGSGNPVAGVFRAGMAEWRRSIRPPANQGERDAVLIIGLEQRVAETMAITVERELQQQGRWLPVLELAAACAPVAGALAAAGQLTATFAALVPVTEARLADLAPGVAQALVAPTLGLAAALPAMVGSRMVAAALGRYRGRLEGFAAEFRTLLSRQVAELASTAASPRH